MKEPILNIMKQQMKNVVEDLDYDNLRETKNYIERCFTLLESVSLLPVLEQQLEDLLVKSTNLSEKPSTSSNGPYVFHRNLKGGVLKDADIFVPEGVIRKLNLKPGDKVFAKKVKDRPFGPPIYDFEVAERGDGNDPEDRIQIGFAIVEHDKSLNRLVCQKTADGRMIRYDEAPYTVILSEEDVREFHLEEGDIIDLAFSKHNPRFVRVLWKHLLDLQNKIIDSAAPENENEREEEGEEQKFFTGKKICMIGSGEDKEPYREVVETNGGEFLWIDVTDNESTIEETLSQVDVVIVPLHNMQEQMGWTIVDYCKSNDIPIGTLHALAPDNFLAVARRTLVGTPTKPI